MEARAVWYRSSSKGTKPALVFVGRKRAHVVTVNPDVRTAAVKLSELDHMRAIDCPPLAIAERLSLAGERHGMTKGAERLLRSVR